MPKATETGKIGFKCSYLPGLLLIALVIGTLHLKYDEQMHKVVKEDSIERDEVKNVREEKGECNLFSGKWVYDNESYPLYKEGDCSFLGDDFSCEKYGRKDLKYQNWRWQPRDCDLPRFNGTALLEKIRRKKLIFVGDSLIRNQWKSMLCLIESSLPPSSVKSVIRTNNLFYFHANDYNATIGYYWSPFLVESNSDDPEIHRVQNRVIRIQAIEKHARIWNDADILVFDSFMWWLEPKMTLLWGSFNSLDAVYKKVEMKLRLYEMGLNTWSQWLEVNINRTKTKMFFMSVSPYHETDENLNMEKNCYTESEPIANEGYWGLYTDRRMMEIAESAIEKLERRGLRVEYINITQMSEYRIDAHPSIYKEFYRNITEEELRNPRSYSDCVHWCLPGVPDAWNQILYAYLINS